MHRFVEKEITGAFPRELYRKAAEVGLLQPGFPKRMAAVRILGGAGDLRGAKVERIDRETR